MDISVVVGLLAAVLGVVFFLFLRKQPSPDKEKAVRDLKQAASEQPAAPAASNKDKTAKDKKKAAPVAAKNHPLLLTQLKGHSEPVLAVSFVPDGLHVVTASSDRTVRFWSVDSFHEKGCSFTRTNVELDHALSLVFSPDAKAFVVGLAQKRGIRVFKFGGKKESVAVNDIPDGRKPPSDSELIAVGLAKTDKYKYMVTCYADTSFHIWSTKGELLHTVDTKLMNNNYLAVSPCGKFIACSGFTGSARLYEVQSTEPGIFQGLHEAMSVGGHKSGVLHFAFSVDSTRIATVSKDGSWRLFDIDVRYKQREDPRQLATGSFDFRETARIAVSPDLFTVAVVSGSILSVYSAEGPLLGTLDAHPGSLCRDVAFDSESHHIVTCGDDRCARVWYNKWGLENKIQMLEEKKKRQDKEAQKVRIEDMLQVQRELLRTMEAEIAAKSE